MHGGNHIVTNSNLPQLAMCNPFRYRGYYYDVETSLYYCNTRYYSPKLCRWISPDSTEYLDPQSINGLNLYAYCNNDPINKYDPSGHSALLIGMLIGFGGAILIGGGVVVLSIVAGTILIAVLSDALDNWWEKKKEEWFN